MARFGRRSTAEQVSAGADLRGQNVLVTGANTGLGLETTRVLALRGARVIMACRDQDKAAAARQSLLDAADGAIDEDLLELHELDLNSLARVRESAAAFSARQLPLHILINNAGIMIPMERRTEDGFEAHLGINHLGHFLFSELITDSLRAAPQSRLVVLSSSAMGMASLTPALEDLNWEQRKFSGLRSYGDSKLMNLLFAREFTRRHAADGIVANAVHPGVIATELARDQSLPFMALGMLALPFMKTVPRGAATSVLVATAEDCGQRGGRFYSNCAETRPPHKLGRDDTTAAALWQRSEELVGLAG